MKALSFKNLKSPFVIAEIGQTHDGNVNIAHAFIDAVAETGADAIKFQTHIAEEESTPGEPWRVKFSHQDASRYDYWKRMEFTEEQWAGLKTHADEKGLVFLSSPFSMKAIELLERVGVPAWKIGSGEVLSERMLDAAATTGKPIIMSSGMSDLTEIDGIIARLKQRGAEYALMQCTTAYPTKNDEVGLNIVEEFIRRYDCPVGLSDHSGTIWPSIAAVSMGAMLVEVHVTMSRDMFGPDVSSSVTTEELAQMVQGIRSIHEMRENPVDKSKLSDNQKEMRKLFMKSLVARNDLEAGILLNACNMIEKKPGGGIPGYLFDDFCGVELVKPLKRDEQVTWDHISATDREKIKKTDSAA